GNDVINLTFTKHNPASHKVDGGTGTDTLTVNYSETSRYYGHGLSYKFYKDDNTNVLFKDNSAFEEINNVINNKEYTKFVAESLITDYKYGYLEFSNIENQEIVGRDASRDLFIHNTVSSVFNGLGGNDTVYADLSDWTSDIVLTNTQEDRISITEKDNALSIQNIERLLLKTGSGNDHIDNSINNTNDHIDTGTGDDVITTGGGDDIINAGDGDDTLNGGTGSDILNGGDGNDTASFGDASNGVVVDLTITKSQNTKQGNDTLIDIENLQGSNYDDVLTGNTEDNVLKGGAGNDTLRAGLGNDILNGSVGDDIIDGGADTDIASFVDAENGVVVDLRITETQNTGQGNDTLIDIENLQGSNYDDVLTGNAEDNILKSGAGNDVLSAGLGNDTLCGGIGDDVIDGSSGTDTASFVDAENGVVVDLRITEAQNTGQGNDTLIDIEKLQGSNHDDVLTGNAEDNVLKGYAGNDTLNGGIGDDILDGGSDTDTASFVDAENGVVVDLRITESQNTGQGNDTLIDIENLQGSSYDDVLTGNAEDNVLKGYAGNDTFYGGMGDDKLSGGSENDTLYGGIGNDKVYGGTGHDKLYGGKGDDWLSGYHGNDIIYGGNGNDKLYGEDGDDRLEGYHGNDMIYGGNGRDKLYGESGHDTLYGGTGDDKLSGGSENDTLYGGIGNDKVYGGTGHDKLYGGKGDDWLSGYHG
ncbi:calcium-binding protein, partial [Pasteurella atlantica]